MYLQPPACYIVQGTANCMYAYVIDYTLDCWPAIDIDVIYFGAYRFESKISFLFRWNNDIDYLLSY